MSIEIYTRDLDSVTELDIKLSKIFNDIYEDIEFIEKEIESGPHNNK